MRRWFTPKRVSLLALLAVLGVGGGVLAQQGANVLVMRSAFSGSAPAIVAQGLDTNISVNVVPKGTGVLQVNGSAIVPASGGTFAALTVTPGPFAVTGTSTFTGAVGVTGDTSLTGALFIRPGTSAVLKAVGARLFHNVTDAPTTGTVAETLYTYTMPANTLAVDGQSLDINVWATTAANANNKTLEVVFGATSIGTSTAAGFNGETMQMRCNVYRTAAATQKGRCNFQSFTTGTLTANQNTVMFQAAPAETLSGPVVIIVRGTTPTAAADLTAQAATIDWKPVGQ